MTELEKSILATLVYYDVLDRPLTSWEVFRYLIQCRHSEHIRFAQYKLREESHEKSMGLPRLGFAETRNDDLKNILKTLENSPELEKLIDQQNGFYFLKGRQEIIRKRVQRQKIADQKWKKARRIIKFLQLIPYIRLVAVSGSLAMNNTKEKSDIDLLIITQAGRIWTCRGLITFFLRLFGQYRHKNLTKNRFCLNHYLTDQSLKILFKSLYNAQTYAHLTTLWQRSEDLYQKFQQANQWLKDYLIFYPFSQQGYLRKIRPSRFLHFLRKIKEFILDRRLGDRLELILKKFQIRRIKKDPLTYQRDGRVVFNDQQLEFHPNSPEKRILDKYNQKMGELGLLEMGQEKDSGLTI